MTPRHKQRGVALLIALLVVALATVLIAGLLDRGELAWRACAISCARRRRRRMHRVSKPMPRAC